ncbi:MAG: type II toxin-antitoxin system RelE/ParE family toxin [Nitrospinae bacterium]|nr:type II toxin-antitoxin system RelE/ParE family toxin [Nitrospinota bacterium]
MREMNLQKEIYTTGNNFHALSGDRKGQYAISINKKWRICFNWQEGNANNVEIIDYH